MKFFEILGMCENEDLYSLKTRIYTTCECKTAYLKKFGKNGTYDLNASGVLQETVFKKKSIKGFSSVNYNLICLIRTLAYT